MHGRAAGQSPPFVLPAKHPHECAVHVPLSGRRTGINAAVDWFPNVRYGSFLASSCSAKCGHSRQRKVKGRRASAATRLNDGLGESATTGTFPFKDFRYRGALLDINKSRNVKVLASFWRCLGAGIFPLRIINGDGEPVTKIPLGPLVAG